MAFIRSRTTKAGAVSTALVEAYRDEHRRPRQRVLANMHGAPDVLGALAKLAAQRERLRKEKTKYAPDIEQARTFYETVTTNALIGHRYGAGERKEIDRLLKLREKLLKRAAKIDATLATIQKDGAVLRKYCTAIDAEIQAAIKVYQKKLSDAEAGVIGSEFMLNNMKAELRTISV